MSHAEYKAFIGIYADPKVKQLLVKFADKHKWSLSKTAERLIKLALDDISKNKYDFLDRI